MEVRAVRQEPNPPPVEKVVIELSRYEAVAICGLIRDYREGWALKYGRSRDWGKADSEATTLVNAIERELD